MRESNPGLPTTRQTMTIDHDKEH